MMFTALEIMERNPLGYFLMVENGRIDHAMLEALGWNQSAE